MKKTSSRTFSVLVVCNVIIIFCLIFIPQPGTIATKTQIGNNNAIPKIETQDIAIFLGDESCIYGKKIDNKSWTTLLSSKFGWFEYNLCTAGNSYDVGFSNSKNTNLVTQISQLEGKVSPKIIILSLKTLDIGNSNDSETVGLFQKNICLIFQKMRNISSAAKNVVIPPWESFSLKPESLSLVNSVLATCSKKSDTYIVTNMVSWPEVESREKFLSGSEISSAGNLDISSRLQKWFLIQQ